jgi:hypothetical protein
MGLLYIEDFFHFHQIYGSRTIFYVKKKIPSLFKNLNIHSVCIIDPLLYEKSSLKFYEEAIAYKQLITRYPLKRCPSPIFNLNANCFLLTN